MNNKPNTICRVCGKEYFCCSDSKQINSWRTMACSQECFQEYMRRVEEARNPKPVVENKITKSKKKTTNETVESKENENNED